MVKCPNCQLFFKYFDFRCYYFDSRLMLIYLSIRNLMWDLVFFFFFFDNCCKYYGYFSHK